MQTELVYAPDGSIHIEQLASYRMDRTGIDTIMDFALTDLRSYTLDRDTSRTTSQVTAYGGAWDSTAGVFVLYPPGEREMSGGRL